MGGNAVFKGEDCVEELCESAFIARHSGGGAGMAMKSRSNSGAAEALQS